MIGNRLSGRQTPPFRYRDKGGLATIGRAKAVAEIRRLGLSGLPAWLAWLLVHLFYLIGLQNRLSCWSGGCSATSRAAAEPG